MINKIISTSSSETTIKLTNRSFWVNLTSKGNAVEGKIYFPKKITDKLVIFEPGFPGSGSTQFEQLWLDEILGNGHTVFLVRHSGTIINGKFSDNYLNCPKRQKLALKTGQKIIGIKKSPTIGDWLTEPITAVESLGQHFKEIYLVGHSFGPLALIYSLIDLSLRKSPLVRQIVRVISLAGAIGRARGEKDNKLEIWYNHLNTDWARDRVLIGSAKKNTDIFAGAHNKINDQASKFPQHVEFIGVTPLGDKLGTVDDLVSPIETVEFVASLGKSYLILDKTQYSDKKSGRLAHDMENLKAGDLLRFLDKKWRPKQQITVLS